MNSQEVSIYKTCFSINVFGERIPFKIAVTTFEQFYAELATILKKIVNKSKLMSLNFKVISDLEFLVSVHTLCFDDNSDMC